jgi:hypothetical protein
MEKEQASIQLIALLTSVGSNPVAMATKFEVTSVSHLSHPGTVMAVGIFRGDDIWHSFDAIS